MAVSEQQQLRRNNSNAFSSSGSANLNPVPSTFGLDQKVVIRRQQPSSQQGIFSDNINSTTLQDYSEYQLSFQ